MDKIPLLPSDRIRNTTTSKIAFIGLAAATIMITASMIGAIQMQQASAAKPDFCFPTISTIACSNSMKNCRSFQAQAEEAGVATGPCHPQRF